MKFIEGNELILEFMVINICTGIWVGMVNFIIPIYGLYLHASSVEIGLIRGLSGIGDLLLVLPAGLLIDYFGSKKTYTVSCTIGAIMTVVLSLAGTPWMLIFMMIFYGMARSVRTTSLNASFFKYMNVIGAKKGGWYKGSMTIGSQFFGPLIGGALAVVISFTNYFMLTSMFLLVPLFIVGGKGDDLMLKASEKEPELSGALKYYGLLLKNKVLLLATVTECVNSAFFTTFSTFITIMIIEDVGLAVAVAAMLISLRGVANIVVVFFCGRLLDLNNNYLYFISFVMTAIGLLFLGTSTQIPLLMLGAVIIGLSSGISTLITFTQVGGIDGEKGKIAGIFSFGQKIGTIAGPVLGGIIAELIGVHAIFLFFIPLFLVMAFYTFTEGRKTVPAVKIMSQ